MTKFVFYQLADNDKVPTLRSIVGKSRERGWRVAIRCSTESEAKAIDDALWRTPDDGFLPHARSGSGFDADQPILIVTDNSADNRPDALVMLGTFELGIGQLSKLQRVCVLFNGENTEELASAQLLSKTFKNSGTPVECWVNEHGRWRNRQEL